MGCTSHFEWFKFLPAAKGAPAPVVVQLKLYIPVISIPLFLQTNSVPESLLSVKMGTKLKRRGKTRTLIADMSPPSGGPVQKSVDNTAQWFMGPTQDAHCSHFQLVPVCPIFALPTFSQPLKKYPALMTAALAQT